MKFNKVGMEHEGGFYRLLFPTISNSKFLIINNFSKEYKISVGKKTACLLIIYVLLYLKFIYTHEFYYL